MSFYTYKQPIRQEGFHLPPSPPPSNSNSTPPPSSSYDLFNTIPEYKPPAFSDELASLMSNERGSPGMYDDYTTQHQHQHQQRHTHNIFDISAPTSSMHNQLASSASSTASFPPSYNANSNNGANGANGAHSQPSSYHHPTPSTHFNSTLPALGSVRYEPERSRSRSRPPSGGDAVGPQRTVRSRRGGSVSSTSPPPGKPGAIVIPGQQQRGGQVGSPMSPGGTWFGSGSTSTPTTEYLPTPDSLHSHSLHHQHSSHQGYTPFSLPSPGGDMHLPPLAHHHKDMHRDIMSAPRDIMSSTGPRDIMSSPRDILHPHQHTSSSYGISPPLSSSLTGALSSLGPLSPLTSPITPSLMSSSIPVSSSLNHGVNGNGMTAQDKQALLANEKRRRRRESHNAVERRRRDNINEKISELATLIPECMLEGGTSTSPAPVALDPDTLVPPASANGAVPAAVASSAQDKKDEDADGGVVKANKGMILRKSVEYIRYLQQLVTAQGARNRELEQELKAYRSGSVSSSGEMDATSPGGGGLRSKEDGADEEGMMLHDDSPEFQFSSPSSAAAAAAAAGGEFGINGEFYSKYAGGLGSMPEEGEGGDMMDDDASLSPENVDDEERERERERERGRGRALKRVKEEDEAMVA